jgi:hypothetical protein
MAQALLECWPKGRPNEKIAGANTRYTAAPHAFAMGLEPNTDYEASVRLTDPYGNTFDSLKEFGPLPVQTGPAPTVKVFYDETFKRSPIGMLTFKVPEGNLDDRGEIHLHFLSHGRAAPEVLTGSGVKMLNWRGRSFRVGGAVADVPDSRKEPLLDESLPYHLVLRWRRFPLTRELYIVAKDGTEFLLSAANHLPWNPADGIGDRIEIPHAEWLSRIVITDDTPPAPWEHRRPLPHRFDRAAFQAANDQ